MIQAGPESSNERALCLVKSLSHLGLRSANLDGWSDFAGGVLGMQVVRDGDDRLRLRMDEMAHRYILRRADDAALDFIGFDVGCADDLAALQRHLAASARPLVQGTPEEIALRAVADMMWLTDPDGNRIEFSWGLERSEGAFVPGKPIGGFRTGDLGMGHLVLYTPRYTEMTAFYQSLLSFRLTDYHHEPFPIDFLRVNARHHSLALISDGEGQPRIHHVMMEYQYWDDLGRAYDWAQQHPESIAVSLGRHLNDHMTSFYVWTPDAFFIEVGWAGRSIEDEGWEPTDLAAPSLWGHVRNWQTPEKRAQTRKMVEAIGQAGIRAPVAAWSDGPFSPPPKGSRG